MAIRPTPERFPERMRAKSRWICWIWGERGTWRRFNAASLEAHDGHLWHRDANGMLTQAEKLPISPRTLRAASVDNPDTWTTFDAAMATLRSGRVDGMGYVLDRSEVLLDLDGCISEDGEPSLFARTCIGELDSYAELSVSGKGIHILVVADGFNQDRGYKSARLEVYSGGHTNRYCTVTGHVLDGCEDVNEDAEDVLTGIYQDEFADRPVISREAYEEAASEIKALHSIDLAPEDARIVAWVCGHFKWGRAMFERGDYLGWAKDRRKYWDLRHCGDHKKEERSPDSSRSAADAALASYLLAGAEGDAMKAWALLNKSALWRPKYDEIHDGKNLYSVMTVARVSKAVDHVKMRRNALERRDRRLAQYPSHFSQLADLMRRDDVTHYMLQRVMCTRAKGTARRRWDDEIERYPIDWIIRWWEQVVQEAYSYDLINGR